MDLKGKKVLVFGAGKSGIGAADLLGSVGAQPIIYDGNENLDKEAVLHKTNGTYTPEIWAGAFPEGEMESLDLVVLSPGVPTDLPLVKSFYEKGLPVWSEVELAYRTGKGEVLAITGTNGKTTTTALLGKIMGDARESVFVVGNIGTAYTSKSLEMREDSVTVAEISSFQLETTKEFCPVVSALLNVTPDHLNRHKTMENYTLAKAKIFANQGEDGYFVYNADDAICVKTAALCHAKTVPFSRKKQLDFGAFVRDGKIVISDGTSVTEICGADELQMPGLHNLENALAGAAIAYFAGIAAEPIADTLRSFTGVSHRIERCGSKNGVFFVNDSKGTNPDAAVKAVISFENIILIAGGYDKGSEYDEFIASFDGHVKELVLMGVTAPKIREAAEKVGFVNIHNVKNMKEAVEVSYRLAEPGDTILLSPACASWGQFDNYEQRGDMFKEYVRNL